jgi:hypothetical protein
MHRKIYTMTTLHFTMYLTVDQEVFITKGISNFRNSAEAEDIMHSMECGVFNDDYVKYHADKIVYELEEA